MTNYAFDQAMEVLSSVKSNIMSLDRVQVAKLAVIGVAGLTLYEQLSYHIKSKFTIPGMSHPHASASLTTLIHI
jgi:hypothetical protein